MANAGYRELWLPSYRMKPFLGMKSSHNPEIIQNYYRIKNLELQLWP